MKIKGAVVSLAVLGLAANLAFADLTTRIRVNTTGPGSGNGGVFNITVVAGSLPGIGGIGSTFQTFCVELNETLSNNGLYWVEVNTAAENGGLGGGDPDPLDAVTAGLYSEWLGLGDNTDATANNYQLAIWATEQEALYDGSQTRWEQWHATSSGGALHSAYSGIGESVITTLQSNAPTLAGGIGNIRVLNLYNNANRTGFRQDLLVPIPAPGAAVLGLIGVSAIGWVKRRFA